MRVPLSLLALSIAFAAPISANALNIVISNDDGLSTNVKALQSALLAAGHDVVVSVPCQNQSGKGAAVNFLTPITPLTKACRNDAAPVGAAGVGPIAGLSNAFYVDGTPIMALMYGLDIAAIQRWGKAPDLVISGPNEGQNIGSIVISSGTVSNAQFALIRGIPAIAVSADANTTDNPTLAAEAASLTLKLVAVLEQQKSHKTALLPSGYALNVNYPKFAAGESSKLPWSLTRFGNFDAYETKFTEDLGADPVAAAYGLGNYHFPGVTLYPHSADEATRQTDPRSEALLSLKGYVTVTPMQFGYEATPDGAARLERCLNKSLMSRK